MPITWYAMIGLFTGLLINRAADCWLNPVPAQCGTTRRPLRQWLVLVGTPALAVFFVLTQEDARGGWSYALFGAVFLLLGVIDLEQKRVPDVIAIPATLIALIIHWQAGDLLLSVAGAVLALVSFAILFIMGRKLFGPGALGLGDVKLAMLLGAVFGLWQIVYVLLLGVILAGLASAFGLASGRFNRKDSIPYGSFLALSGLGNLFALALIPGASSPF
jgi:prepilin signal peptidase PulO-like enzyme (type II secretory pathway)